MPVKKPKDVHLFWSPLSHRIYATRAYKEVEKKDGGRYIEVTGQKFDVTDQIKQILDTRQIEWGK